MKFALPLKSCPDSSAFTLIELLIVISIIATLMGIGSQVARIAMQRARVAQAKVQITTLKNAMRSYQSEYGSFPVDSGDEHQTEGLVMQALMGGEDQAAELLNPRGIVFFTTGRQASRPNAPGFVTKLHRLNDPWGTPFEFTIDVGGSGKVMLPSPYHDTYGPSLPGVRVFIHSAGPDRKLETTEDNVHQLQ